MAAGDYVPDILLTYELLTFLGKPGTARESLVWLEKKPGFPKAAGAFHAGRYWLVSEVEKWAKASGIDLHYEALDTALDEAAERSVK